MLFWPRKIAEVGIQCKLNDNITRFSISTYSEFWLAPIIMVGDDNGIQRMWSFLLHWIWYWHTIVCTVSWLHVRQKLCVVVPPKARQWRE
jgi:hypothetical protein